MRAYNRMRANQFEHTRVIVYTLASANRDPKKPWPSIEEFWPLPTDKDGAKKEKKGIEQQRKELLERINSMYGETLLKNHGKLLA